MGNPAQKKDLQTQRILALVIGIVLLVILIVTFVGRQNSLKDVTIERVGQGLTQSGLSDSDIIRASGLKMGSSVTAVEASVDSIRSGINELGLVKFVELTRSGSNAVTIRVEERVPCLALAAGSSYLVTDAEGCVIGRYDDVSRLSVLKVTGLNVDSTGLYGGKALVSREELLDNALQVGQAVIAKNFVPLVSSLSIYNDTYRLIMDTGLIVRFYMGDDLYRLLDIVQGFFNEGITTGEVIVSGGQAAYNPRVVDYEVNDR